MTLLSFLYGICTCFFLIVPYSNHRNHQKSQKFGSGQGASGHLTILLISHSDFVFWKNKWYELDSEILYFIHPLRRVALRVRYAQNGLLERSL